MKPKSTCFEKHRFLLLLSHWITVVAISVPVTIFAADPFAENVRTTDPLTPAEEQKAFHLPPGFKIELFAAEPEIQKPLNMAFDEKGRLWVTDSREYPFPVPLDKRGRDSIKILEDTDGDGRADKVTTFADGLNIPTGVYPYKNGVIAWSIPNIWYFQDTDGDGKADKREVLFGPLGWERDTHGMDSSFRRGFDGWLYMTHGYNNNTTVRGTDGSQISMNSGNVYRVRPDGSRVEQFTWGQVNPFGLCFDAMGNLYSADCHSAPIYQLLRGGYYPSFGKPHDGLGFAPTLMQHSHGSTAIAGIAYYSDDRWPAQYRDNMFIGNVMTSRVNRDTMIERGTTKVAREEPDLVTTDDPWFRPVDLQFGPDGALYIADFYNRIIGHYEVPLTHPGRDRERGRIWRLSYVGESAARSSESKTERRFDLSKSSATELIQELASANMTRRMLAMNQLVDRVGSAAIEPVKKLLGDSNATAFQKIHGLWVLHRLGGLDTSLVSAAGKDGERSVRVHAMHVLSEAREWLGQHREIAVSGLKDSDALVQRAAADALGQHPDFENITPLLQLRQQIPAADTHLLHVTRMALRNQLKPEGVLKRLQASDPNESDARALADLVVAIPSTEAGVFLLQYVQKFREPRDTLKLYLRHIARYAPGTELDQLAVFSRREFKDDIDLQLGLFKSVQEGMAQRGSTPGSETRVWGAELAERLLASVEQTVVPWVNHPVEGMTVTTNPWFVQQRVSADTDSSSPFLCSLPPGGEALTGILRSKPFIIPAQLKFFVAGHDGYPGKPAQKRNVVRLRLANSGAMIVEKFAPRNDLAQPVSWELNRFAGQLGFLEVVDADNGNAYAWLAVGRFTPAVVPIPAVDPSQIPQRQQAAADLARTLNLAQLEPRLTPLLADDATDLDTRAAVVRTLMTVKPNEALTTLASVMGDATVPAELRKRLSQSVVGRGAVDPFAAITEALRTAAYRVQIKLAQALAGTSAGAEKLLDLAERGQISRRLLLERSVKDKLSATQTESQTERIRKLAEGLAPASADLEKLIQQRRNDYDVTKVSSVEGARIFAKTCAVCHQIDGQGALIGPQLDGIGNRGLDRLLEDVLDPNRNVDRAFRTHILTLNDGEAVSGLPRREEGELLILADGAGKETSIPKKNIRARRETETSLMPENFGELLSRDDLNNLMAFLLSKGATAGGGR